MLSRGDKWTLSNFTKTTSKALFVGNDCFLHEMLSVSIIFPFFSPLKTLIVASLTQEFHHRAARIARHEEGV